VVVRRRRSDTVSSQAALLVSGALEALDILELLQNEHGPLALEAIHQRANISKTTVYRILKTFMHRGYLAQSQEGLYRLVARPKKSTIRFWKSVGGDAVF
jgi:ribose transport system substrate-binding protein